MLGSFTSGQGNLGSDQHQFDNYRHFDSAPNAQAVCDRANAAWSQFYGAIIDSIKPQNPPEYDVVGGIADARSAFGALTHALQDFYAHSNWVDLYVAAHQPPPLALMLFPTCAAASLPTNIQTGFFDLSYNLVGCPYSPLNGVYIPPAPFTYCHETLNKDSDQTLHGKDLVPGTNQTYSALAAQLAASHTTELYNTVFGQLLSDLKTAFPQVRSDCLVQRVMVVDLPQPCRYSRLSFHNPSQSAGTRLSSGTVTIRDHSGATVLTATVSSSSWPAPVVDVPQCLAGLSVQWKFYVNDTISTPTPREVTGTAQPAGPGCDADVNIVPEDLITYLIRYTNSDTVIQAYTNIQVTINNGQRIVNTGPVTAGTTIWIDLGPNACSSVSNLDFIYSYLDPNDGTTPRTATPDPNTPPFQAVRGCLDTFDVDLGGQIYGP